MHEALNLISQQIEQDEEFRRWLETEYTPIAGGWQY